MDFTRWTWIWDKRNWQVVNLEYYKHVIRQASDLCYIFCLLLLNSTSLTVRIIHKINPQQWKIWIKDTMYHEQRSCSQDVVMLLVNNLILVLATRRVVPNNPFWTYFFKVTNHTCELKVESAIFFPLVTCGNWVLNFVIFSLAKCEIRLQYFFVI